MNEDEIAARDAAFARSVRAALDRAVPAPDPHERARLRAARERALRAQRRPVVWPAWGGVAAGAACVLALVGVLAMPWRVPGAPGAQTLEALDWVSAEEGIEFYEDLEFVEWLDATQAG